MSIQSEIDRINQAKTDLAAAIESKGVTVPPNTTINVYPGLVQQIEQGAGLPSGGTPGQMLYQGESGPEWGDKPVMYVTITGDAENVYSADKTNAEIYQAYQNGYAVFAKIDGILSIPLFQVYSVSDEYYAAIFSSYNLVGMITIMFSIDGQIVVQSQGIDSSDISFTPGTTGLTSDNVQDAIEEVNAKIPAKPQSVTATLPASGWSSNTQTVTVQGVLADESAQLIQPMPAMVSQTAYYEAGILCTGQAANQLTFTCQNVPTEDLTVYVVIQGVTA